MNKIVEKQKKIKPHSRNRSSNVSYAPKSVMRSDCKIGLYHEYLKDSEFNTKMLKIFKNWAKENEGISATKLKNKEHDPMRGLCWGEKNVSIPKHELLSLCYEYGLALSPEELIHDFFIEAYLSWQEEGSPEKITNTNIDAIDAFKKSFYEIREDRVTFHKIEIDSLNFVWEIGTGQTRGSFTKKAIKKFTSKLDGKLDEIERKIVNARKRLAEGKFDFFLTLPTQELLNEITMARLHRFRGKPVRKTAIRWLYQKLRGHSWNQIAGDAIVSVSTARSEVKRVAKILEIELPDST